jgi:hypothetical protein
MLKKLLVACVGAATLLVAGVAMGGVPCASTSTVDVSVIHSGTTSCTSTEGAFCPAGDLDTVQIDVTIEDCYGNALAGRTVTINLPAGFIFGGDAPVPFATDALGQGTVWFACIGGCGFAQYTATCDAVLI